MMIEPFILACACAVTVVVAYCICFFAAQARMMLDHPNERSSHEQATPRLGGVGIIAGWLAGVFVIVAFTGDLQMAGVLGRLALCAVLAFALGYADDRDGLSPVWKLVGQIVIAAIFTMLFSPLSSAPLPFWGEVSIPVLIGAPLTIIWIVAFMNAFNFMDGSNGMAGGAAAVGLAWMSVIASFAGAPVLAVAALLLALGASAFLPENLVRGKLFMGDNGSQAIGFLIAAFAVLGVNMTGAHMGALVTPVIFLPFLFDVGWTLVSRAIRKQNVMQAHCEHLYQLMLRSGASHARVAVVYMALVSLCAAAAIIMLAFPPVLHWMAPLCLAIVFALGAAAIYRKAGPAGFLARPAPDGAVLSAAE